MPRKNRQKSYNPVGPVQLIEIRVDGDDVAAALAQMQNKTPQACRNAINATARKARTVMANKARKKYHIKSKVMRSENDMHFEKATLDRMEAMLRIKRLKQTHPRQYEFALGGGEWTKDENSKPLWTASKGGLGYAKVFDWVNEIYGKDFYRYE